jgi:hypothetical protein
MIDVSKQRKVLSAAEALFAKKAKQAKQVARPTTP